MWNPFKTLKDIIIFFYNDIKSDINFIHKVAQGDMSVVKKVDNWKEVFDIKGIMKEYWIFFLIVILAFMVGYVVASKKYEVLANSFIVEHCAKSTLDKFSNIDNFSLLPIINT